MKSRSHIDSFVFLSSEHRIDNTQYKSVLSTVNLRFSHALLVFRTFLFLDFDFAFQGDAEIFGSGECIELIFRHRFRCGFVFSTRPFALRLGYGFQMSATCTNFRGFKSSTASFRPKQPRTGIHLPSLLLFFFSGVLRIYSRIRNLIAPSQYRVISS